MEKEYNELTKRLLAEGYTADNHPHYVMVGRCCQEKNNPLRNFDGGFQYYRWYVYDQTFQAPCGLMCKGSSCMSSMFYNLVEWCYENDLATIRCPYSQTCELRDPRLPQDGIAKNWCAVHMIREKYQYDGSLEMLQKLRDEEIRQQKESFILRRKGCACENHMHYNNEKGTWEMHYSPATCVHLKCRTEFCPILNKELDKKRGNVFYDLKISYRRTDLDGTLFEGQIDTYMEKGKKVFAAPVSMDICKSYVKLCKDELIKDVRMKYHTQLFFAEYYEGHDFFLEVLNIRAEQRRSRDLMQDLRDISEGIQIVHASDREKAAKAIKRKKREQLQEKRILRLEKKLLQTGYENLEEFSLDRVHADKWLGKERIQELEEMRQKRIQEDKTAPVQLSIFDCL